MKSIFLLLLQLGPILALYYPDGCEVRSEWEIDYKWSTVKIGFWIPREENSEVLSIEIEVEGQSFPLAYDNLEIFNQSLTFTRKREGQPTITNVTEIHAEKLGLWVDYIFAVNTHYIFYNYHTNVILFQEEVTTTPTKLRIKGAYITINCLSDTRVWSVNENPVVIPLDDQEVHTLAFFSTKSFEATLSLDERIVHLGWHNGAISMIPTAVEPLPSFQKHLVEFQCHDDGQVLCDIMLGSRRRISEKDMQLRSIPTFLTVKSEKGEFFVVEDIKDDLNTVYANKFWELMGLIGYLTYLEKLDKTIYAGANNLQSKVEL